MNLNFAIRLNTQYSLKLSLITRRDLYLLNCIYSYHYNDTLSSWFDFIFPPLLYKPHSGDTFITKWFLQFINPHRGDIFGGADLQVSPLRGWGVMIKKFQSTTFSILKELDSCCRKFKSILFWITVCHLSHWIVSLLNYEDKTRIHPGGRWVPKHLLSLLQYTSFI